MPSRMEPTPESNPYPQLVEALRGMSSEGQGLCAVWHATQIAALESFGATVLKEIVAMGYDQDTVNVTRWALDEWLKIQRRVQEEMNKVAKESR